MMKGVFQTDFQQNSMITNIFYQIKLYRRIRGGVWFKTKHKGWITLDLLQAYYSYAFDPEVLQEEVY